MDGLANDTVPPEGLRVCNDVDYSKPPLGGVTIRPPIANRPLTKDLAVKRLIRLDNYEYGNWPYIVISQQPHQIWVINPELDEWRGPIDSPIWAGHPYMVPVADDKIFLWGSTGGNAVLEKNGPLWSDWSIRRVGFLSEAFSGTAGDANTAALEDGDHIYQLILTDKSGHRSVPRDEGIIIPTETSGTADEGQVAFSALPTCVGDHKYLYRTLTDVSQDDPEDPDAPLIYYLVDVLGGDDLTYTDTKPDASITGNHILQPSDYGYPDHDLVPIALFNGRLWSAHVHAANLVYTPQFDYENWPAINAIPIGDGDPILFLQALGDKMLIFKRSSIYAFWGDSLANWDYRKISSVYGVGFTPTIKAIDSQRVIFLDPQRRVIMYDGNFTEISKLIKVPQSAYYWASLYGDYYILWLYEPIGGQDQPAFRPPPGEDPWDPPDGDEYDPHKPPPSRPPDGPPEDPDNPPEQRPWPLPPDHVIAYAYHIPTGAWVKWNNVKALIPESPDRPGINHLVYWDSNQIKVLGMETGPIQYGNFEITTANTDCGQPLQEKSFKEIELYMEFIGDVDFDGTIGNLQLIIDEGESTEAIFNQTISYNTGSPSKRQKYRIENGLNGTRAAIKFVGNDNMRHFTLMQARLFWQPRGTAIR